MTFAGSTSPRALMAYLGLVPGEDSTGEKHRRGRITRTGNALVRRLLVETAWHYQHRPSIGVALARRRKGQPGRVIAIADKAQQRLCRRFRTPGGTTQARAQDRGGDRARIGRLPLGGAPTGAGTGELTTPRMVENANGSMTRVGDGPRRRRMIRGTIVRIGELAMRYGLSVPTRDPRLHVLPTKHCHVCSAAGNRGNHRISA